MDLSTHQYFHLSRPMHPSISNATQSSHQTVPTCLVPELDVFDANSHQLSGIKGVPLDNKDLVLMPSKPTHTQNSNYKCLNHTSPKLQET